MKICSHFSVMICLASMSWLPCAPALPVSYSEGCGHWRMVDHTELPQLPAVRDRGFVQLENTSIMWNVTYQDMVDGSGMGFDDPQRGQARRAVVEAVLLYLDTILLETGEIDIHWQTSRNNGTGFLATAGAIYLCENGISRGMAFHRITGGSKIIPGIPDINARVDFGYPWNDTLGPPTAGENDLFSVLLHEMTHGLGVGSRLESDGSASSCQGYTLFTQWDDLLHNGSGQKLIEFSGHVPYFAGQPSNLTGGGGGVFFHGPLTMTALEGAPARVHTPEEYEEGSSLSHWDQDDFGGQSVMAPRLLRGSMARAYADFELAALSDLGYNVANLNQPTNTPFATTTPIATSTPAAGDFFPEDLNRDGIVDHQDLMMLLRRWHQRRE